LRHIQLWARCQVQESRSVLVDALGADAPVEWVKQQDNLVPLAPKLSASDAVPELQAELDLEVRRWPEE
jgi:hypothetical protein